MLMYGVLAVTSLGVGDDNFLFVCLCSCILLDTCFFVYFVPHSVIALPTLPTTYHVLYPCRGLGKTEPVSL